MAKTVAVDVKITTKQAQENIDELNKSFEAQEDLIESLESDLRAYEKQLGETSGREVARRSKLNEKIKETKNRLNEEKAGLKTINKERKRANTQLKESTKNTADYSGVIGILDRQTGGAISSVQNLTKSVGGATKGFKFLKAAIAATGIGLLVIAITSVATAFTNSEKGQNKFRKLMTQIGVVVGNVTDILGNFGNAIISFITGNFDEAKESINAVTEGIKNFGEETRKEIEIAGELADARAKADKMERDLIIERAEATRKFNELREKAADKENVSIEDRIAALREAGRIEDEITQKEIEAARIRFETKQQENALSESTKEDLDEEAQLQARLIELEASRLKKQKTLTAEITTNLREQKAEEKRIQAEADAEQKRIDDEKAAKDKEASDAKLAAEKQLADLKKQIRDAEAVSEDEKRALEIEKVTEHYDNLIALATKNGIDITNLEAAKTKRIDELNQTEVEIAELTGQQKVQIAMDTLQLVGMIAGEGSKIGKAAALAQATISTVQGTINAFKTAADNPITTFFPPYPFIQAGIAAAAGVANINKIKSVKVGGSVSAGVATSSSVGGAGGAVATPQAPAFNIVGAGGTNQLAQTIAQQTQQPVKAYVVAGDVTTAQSLDRNIIQESSLG